MVLHTRVRETRGATVRWSTSRNPLSRSTNGRRGASCQFIAENTRLDRNPAVLRRFPVLRRAWSLHLDDITHAFEIGCGADVIIFDAPWYAHDVLMWAAIAVQLVKPSGILAFSLFPPLVRPSATAERQEILEFVSSVGDVEVAEDSLIYDTPLFEREALRGAGIEDPGNWRRGDLVLSRSGGPERIRSDRSQVAPPGQFGARTGGVRSSRENPNAAPRTIQHRGTDLEDWQPPKVSSISTVSARDALRNVIDLWTSRNRVAKVGDFHLVMKVLSRMQHGACLFEAMRDIGAVRAFRNTSHSTEQRIHEVLGGSA